jgi:hypothetical protein
VLLVREQAMDATEALKAASIEASEAVAHIDARIKDKLLKRARKHGMTDEREVTELVEAWKRAARKTKRLQLGHGQHKGH